MRTRLVTPPLAISAFVVFGLTFFRFAAFRLLMTTLALRAAAAFRAGLAAARAFLPGSAFAAGFRASFALVLPAGLAFALVFGFFFDPASGLSAALAVRVLRVSSAGAPASSDVSTFRRLAGLGSACFATAMCRTSGLRIIAGSNTLRTQPNVRASTMSLSTAMRLRPLSSRSTHTTFDSFVFTHFARLCFFSSASSESVSPMQEAAWLTCPPFVTFRREKIKTAGDSGTSAAKGYTSNV